MSDTVTPTQGTPVSVRPGEARCPGPSTRDLILGDSTPPPAQLLVESYAFEGDADVPYEEFTSPTYAALEHEHVWSRTWQWACREEHIPEPGDYYVYDVGDRSAVIVRGPDGSIKAFHNACLHRGTQLKPPASVGYSPKLRCPFHGWTWNLDGELVDLPCDWDFPHVDAEEFRLPQIRTGLWGGFVFVNFDDCAPELMAPSLEEYLGVLPEHFANWDLADRYVEVHIRKRLPANWKASAEAFLEAYHILETHSQSIYTAGDANAQYDVFGDHVSRFIHTIGTTSPHVPEEKRPDEQGILDMLMYRKNPGQEIPTIPEGERARDVYARHMQQVLGEQYDKRPVGDRDDRLDRVLRVPERVLLPRPADPAVLPVPSGRPRPGPLPLRGAVPATQTPFGQGATARRTVRPRRERQLHDRPWTSDVARRRARPGHDEPRRADAGLQVQQEAWPDPRQLPGGARPPLPVDGPALHQPRSLPPMSTDAISDLVHSYADAVVHRDPEQWSATWAVDAMWELGKGRRVEGREAILALWNSAMDGFKAVIQNVVNGTADLDEEAGTGSGRWYIMEHWARADDSRGILLAHYDDTYVRVDGDWLFASRELVIHYGGPVDLSAPFQNAWG
jgi:phenylpropionate dioxygenase-like ring-hydroxylating dioxygenase large terminal subunit